MLSNRESPYFLDKLNNHGNKGNQENLKYSVDEPILVDYGDELKEDSDWESSLGMDDSKYEMIPGGGFK